MLAAYRWLSDNYQEGDNLYFFGEPSHLSLVLYRHNLYFSTGTSGFSRGAYQVRVLAGMIDKVLHVVRSAIYHVDFQKFQQVGLIHKGNEQQIPLFVANYFESSVT